MKKVFLSSILCITLFLGQIQGAIAEQAPRELLTQNDPDIIQGQTIAPLTFSAEQSDANTGRVFEEKNGMVMIEAEDADTNYMNYSSDEYGESFDGYKTVFAGGASGGKALYTGVYKGLDKINEPESVSPTPFTATFNITEGGAYTFWVRAVVPGANSDSFWMKVDGGNYWTAPLDESGANWGWSAVHLQPLTVGTHTIQLCPRERENYIDKIVIAKDKYLPKFLINGRKMFNLAQQSTTPFNGDGVTATFTAMTDKHAATGSSILASVIPNDEEITAVEASRTPMINMDFGIEKETTYAVWVKAFVPAPSQGAIWIGSDHDAYQRKDLPGSDTTLGEHWKWTKLGEYAWSSGMHSLKLIAAKNGGNLDKIYITDDLTYTPSPNMVTGFEMQAASFEHLQSSSYEYAPNHWAGVDIMDMPPQYNWDKIRSAYITEGRPENFGRVDQVPDEIGPLITHEFNVEEEGRYYLFIRAKMTSESADSIWHKIGDSAEGGGSYKRYQYSGPYSQDNRYIILGAYYFQPGKTVVGLFPREWNLMFDKVGIAKTYVGGTENVHKMTYMLDGEFSTEFEVDNTVPYANGAERASFERVSISTGYGRGAMRAIVNGSGVKGEITELDAEKPAVVSQQVHIESGGAYDVWVRAMIDNNTQNAVWARADADDFVKCTLPENSGEAQGQWAWKKLYTTHFTAGNHTVGFTPAKPGGLYDHLAVTKAGQTPSPAYHDTTPTFENAFDISGSTGTYGYINEPNKEEYYKFIPSETNVYELSLATNTILSLDLYRKAGSTYELITSNQENGVTTPNKLLSNALNQGETYYLKVKHISGAVGDYKLCISKQYAAILPRVVLHGGTYFSDTAAGSRLRFTLNNSEQANTVYDKATLWMATLGNTLVFSSRDENGDHAILAFDGIQVTTIRKDNAFYLVSDGTYLYYSNWNDSGSIYRMTLDGNAEKLCADEGAWLYLENGYLYYQNGNDGGALYQISTDGTDRQRVSQASL